MSPIHRIRRYAGALAALAGALLAFAAAAPAAFATAAPPGGAVPRRGHPGRTGTAPSRPARSPVPSTSPAHRNRYPTDHPHTATKGAGHGEVHGLS